MADDIHLGNSASESTVKQSDLSPYRVVYFATHGLIAGEVAGLAEPALALSIPAAASAADDGLLTSSEVAQLKLNAEWVVLSACNTAAGDKKGAVLALRQATSKAPKDHLAHFNLGLVLASSGDLDGASRALAVDPRDTIPRPAAAQANGRRGRSAARGDVLGHVLGVLAHAAEHGRLELPQPRQAEHVQARIRRHAAAMHEGWYVTGDIAAVDDDGFVRITDRLSRFSKIGGEMVPHGRVEEALHAAAGITNEQVFAVTGIPDEKKGERLAVVTTLDAARVEAALAKLAEGDLPNLWRPRKDAFVHVEKIPVLGTGKTDYPSVQKLVTSRLGEAA